MTEEIYVPIVDFETYHVSNLGNVKNVKTNGIFKPCVKNGYYFIILFKNKKRYNKYIHRLVANAFLTNKEGRSHVDHIDNNKLNNNIDNLRFATVQENNRNKQVGKSNTSGYKGVTKSNNKWRACITIDGIYLHLGTFDTIEEARQARVEAVKKAFGDFANVCELN